MDPLGSQRAPSGRPAPCSLLARGWPPDRHAHQAGRGLLPARAGMDPAATSLCTLVTAAPRTSGGGPALKLRLKSPHVRAGMDPVRVRATVLRCVAPRLFAGMDPGRWSGRHPRTPAPRPRGDDPLGKWGENQAADCSPPARGWTPGQGREAQVPTLLPAPAGTDPRTGRRADDRHPASCVCGGSRLEVRHRDAEGLLPARGDGPKNGTGPLGNLSCSPPAWGWTLGDERQVGVPALLPAPAGMTPRGW